MKQFNEILLQKISYYGTTKAAYEFAKDEFLRQLTNEAIDKKVDKIFMMLIGKPKTHQEWAASFNIKGKIKMILTNEKGTQNRNPGRV